MLAIGESKFGGKVFYYNPNDDFCLVVSDVEVVGQPFNADSSADVLETTWEWLIFGSGYANSLAIYPYLSSGDALHTIMNSSEGGYTDWYLPDYSELAQIFTQHYYYLDDSIDFNINTTDEYLTSSPDFSEVDARVYTYSEAITIGDTLGGKSTETPYTQSTGIRAKMVRKQSLTSVAIYDVDESKLYGDSNLSFGFITQDSVPIDAVDLTTQTITIHTNEPTSIILSTYINVEKLEFDEQPTPVNIFGSIPFLRSVVDDSGRVFHSNPNLTSTLSAIENATAYQVTLDKAIHYAFNLVGESLAGDFSFTIPEGASFLPFMAEAPMFISSGRNPLFKRGDVDKVGKIIDLQSGMSFPGQLKKLVPGRGYIINTTDSITVKFK